MNYVLIKDGNILATVKDVELAPGIIEQALLDGVVYLPIPDNIKDKKFYKFQNNEVIADEEKEAEENLKKEKLNKYKAMPSIEDQLLALYYARQGDNTYIQAIDVEMDKIFKK